ncbi:MAG: ATP-binding cassette domain-containing protein [Halanaerobiales bacterium]|nr:ATP-binding cassette domain-containing protein [Halanaerobiales bacterium]
MIQFKEISLAFGDQVVFADFNLNIAEGEKVLLRAASGRGKSTLFKLLLGFQRSDQGEILFKGRRLDRNNLFYFRRNIAYVSQDVDLRNLKVWDLINEIFDYKYNRTISITKEKVMELIDFFLLPADLITKEVGQLSGGERQRLGLIICIMLNRPVWLLDEITTGLDQESKKVLVNYVLKQHKTVLIISHDQIWSKNNLVRVEEW